MTDVDHSVGTDALVTAVLPAGLVESAEAEHAAFELFCRRLGIPVNRDSICLYLTWLHDAQISVRQIRRRLARLNLCARLRGLEPWAGDREVRRFLRGLHREAPLGGTGPLVDPLYRELVELLVAAVMAPTADQLRDRAVLLITAQSGITAHALSRVRWRDVQWANTDAEIAVPPSSATRKGTVINVHATGDDRCPVGALRRLHEGLGAAGGFAFGSTGHEWDAARIRRAQSQLEHAHGDLDSALRRISTSPRQFRNRAILLFGYGAALRTREAIRLRQCDVTISEQGLLLNIAGRDLSTGIPEDPMMPTDPVRAWVDWLASLRTQLRRDPHAPAFLKTAGSTISTRPITDCGLNENRSRRCPQGPHRWPLRLHQPAGGSHSHRPESRRAIACDRGTCRSAQPQQRGSARGPREPHPSLRRRAARSMTPGRATVWASASCSRATC